MSAYVFTALAKADILPLVAEKHVVFVVVQPTIMAHRLNPCATIESMDAEQFTRASRALADPRRMEILERIAREPEVACSVLANESDVSQPTLSHHLKELHTAGLIKPRREGKCFFYRLDRKIWAEYLSEMRRRIPSRPRKG